MKTTMLFTLALFLLLLNACTQSSNTNSNQTVLTPLAAQNIAKEGSWIISYFFDKTNETNTYSNYVFTFGAGGAATAVKNGNPVSGTWSAVEDDDAVKFNVDFGNVSPLDELAGDWHIITATSGEIRLADVSGGKSETDYLTFVKN